MEVVKQIEKEESTSETDDDDDDDDEDEDDKRDQLEGAYDPSKFETLEMTPEVRNIFNFISHYSPQTMELGTRLHPFVPEYIPAVGDVDAFIKIPYPNSKMENTLGLTVLDEPSVAQTDQALLQLKLKTLSRGVSDGQGGANDVNGEGGSEGLLGHKEMVISCTGTAREIETWVENVKHLHETTARPESVTLLHTQAPPDIELLMQEWPEDVESALNVHSIPGPDLDCTLEEYINIVCGVFDIPVQTNKIASLHQLFSLYNEFQSSQHFKKYDNSNDQN